MDYIVDCGGGYVDGDPIYEFGWEGGDAVYGWVERGCEHDLRMLVVKEGLGR